MVKKLCLVRTGGRSEQFSNFSRDIFSVVTGPQPADCDLFIILSFKKNFFLSLGLEGNKYKSTSDRRGFWLSPANAWARTKQNSEKQWWVCCLEVYRLIRAWASKGWLLLLLTNLKSKSSLSDHFPTVLKVHLHDGAQLCVTALNSEFNALVTNKQIFPYHYRKQMWSKEREQGQAIP